MKFTLLFVSCLICIYQVKGGLVKDFFGKVQKTAEIVREDVKKVWRPDSVNSSSTSTTQEDKHDVVSTTSVTVPEIKPAEKKADENIAPLAGETDKKSDEVSKPTSATTPSEVKEVKNEEATTASSSTTTEKEGRENFKANCATGYGRTPDGRCKPTY